HQGSGWEWSIGDLRRYFERVAARTTAAAAPAVPAPPASSDSGSPEAPPPFFAALEHWYLAGATVLGRRTAELHVTLADTTEPAFAPEPLDRAALGALADGMARHAADTLDVLQKQLGGIAEPARGLAEAVLAARPALVAGFDGLRRLDRGGS